MRLFREEEKKRIMLDRTEELNARIIVYDLVIIKIVERIMEVRK